jgi:hypothetical protein
LPRSGDDILPEVRAATFGIDVGRAKTGRITGFGAAPLPDKLESVAGAMDQGEFAYRIMSGFGHTEPWALLRIERAQPTDDPNLQAVPTALEIGWLLGILDRVLDLHNRVVARWMALAGQPFDVWEPAKQPH